MGSTEVSNLEKSRQYDMALGLFISRMARGGRSLKMLRPMKMGVELEEREARSGAARVPSSKMVWNGEPNTCRIFGSVTGESWERANAM